MCECLPGYSGDVCQNSVCDDKECANEGSCMIGEGPSKYHITYQYMIIQLNFDISNTDISITIDMSK